MFFSPLPTFRVADRPCSTSSSKKNVCPNLKKKPKHKTKQKNPLKNLPKKKEDPEDRDSGALKNTFVISGKSYFYP